VTTNHSCGPVRLRSKRVCTRRLPARSPPALSHHLVPSSGSTYRQGVLGATPSPIATEPWGDVPALRTRATVPPGRVSWWCKVPPADSVHHARAARGETACGAPVHRPPSPSRAGSARPTGRASLCTAPAACDTAPPAARGMLGVVARRVPTPRAETGGSRVRHNRDETRSPCRPRPDSCRLCLGGYTIAASRPPNASRAWGSCWDQRR
jgi:hypothetical protein